MKKQLCLIIMLGGMVLTTGCNSKWSGNFTIDRRQITIITEPEGATVTQLHPLGTGATQLGTTPITDQPVVVINEVTKMKNMPFAEAQELYKSVGNAIVVIHKDGYETYRGILTTKPGETVSHTIKLVPKTETQTKPQGKADPITIMAMTKGSRHGLEARIGRQCSVVFKRFTKDSQDSLLGKMKEVYDDAIMIDPYDEYWIPMDSILFIDFYKAKNEENAMPEQISELDTNLENSADMIKLMEKK